jgi:hypothetical protein
MPPISRFVRPILAAVLVTVAAGCSSGGSGSSGLETALARVSDTANNRDAIYYDNTAELVSLAGSSLSVESKGYGQLRGMGASSLLIFMNTLPSDTGINLFDENYAISAGNPPATVTLVAGGQDASLVTGRMTKLGWKKDADGTLTGPSPLTAPGNGGEYAISMGKVRAENSDVLAGGSGANLSQIGSPSGRTLADDPDINALAGCLGNVAAAVMYGGPQTVITAASTEVAVGISQPASATATPHAVVCVSWPSQAAADTYASNVRKALSTGLSPQLNERFSAILPHATVTSVGGDAHVVEWQAGPSNVEAVFDMLNVGGLPALPNCSKLTAAEKAQIIGCG